MSSARPDVSESILETTLNTRDLGRYRSVISGKNLKKWSVLRSDVQYGPSEKDIELLKSKNVRTIIDMRGTLEVQRKPSGFYGRDGFFYFSIPIEEGGGIPSCADMVSKSYMDIAESANIAQIFRTVAGSPGGVMMNCTAGKDRTGVVSAILLGLCGVSDEDIIFDYMLTKSCNRERFRLIHQKFPELDMSIVIPCERYMCEFISGIRTKYGGFHEYLFSIGLAEDEIGKISRKLMEA